MKKLLFPLMLLALLLNGADAGSAKSISFWASTFYTDGTYADFLALSGHTTEGEGPGPTVNVAIMPTGTFTKLTVVTFDPGSPGWTRTATLIKNGAATAASCTIPNGLATCTWTGSIAFADGDLANLQIAAGGGIIIKAPWSIMTVFRVSPTKQDWPFTA